ncbi:contractile injection system tape measure protein [Dyella sp. 2RAB6]|uniref:contractile injection system tape measure protein n=1 Tax=Dyella sp. 2RAB6 TaxID=3232992 RepID=UPI003F93BC9E
MNQARRHVIRRECIDLAVDGGESEGLAVQERIAALCQGALAAALDEAFARVAPGDEHWQFERIEVDAGRFTLESFERDFVAAVATAVEEQVQARKAQAAAQPSIAADEGDVRWSGAQSVLEALLHFLTTGALPWWCHLPHGRTLEAMVSEAWAGAGVHADVGQADIGRVGIGQASIRQVGIEQASIERAGIEAAAGAGSQRSSTILPMRTALLTTLALPVARWRLARQFSGGFLERLLERLAPASLKVLREVAAAVHRKQSSGMPDAMPEPAWVAAFACVVAHGSFSARQLLDAWAALEPGVITPALIESIVVRAGAHDETEALQQQDADPIADERQAMTSNTTPGRQHIDSVTDTPPAKDSTSTARVTAAAKPLDLHEGIFVDCAGVVLLHPFLPMLFQRLEIVADERIVQPDRALALLHFLSTGQASAPEHALVLPKLLCGLPPSALAGAPVELSEADRHEAESLLHAAIEHWPAIGHTSLDGFRGNFLVRAGKLSKRGDDDLLQVEKKSWDILLGQLPWSIGMVRLPWMPRMLWVEWPY